VNSGKPGSGFGDFLRESAWLPLWWFRQALGLFDLEDDQTGRQIPAEFNSFIRKLIILREASEGSCAFSRSKSAS
jgi:hypothetical protein